MIFERARKNEGGVGANLSTDFFSLGGTGTQAVRNSDRRIGIPWVMTNVFLHVFCLASTSSPAP